MASLGCFKDKHALSSALISPELVFVQICDRALPHLFVGTMNYGCRPNEEKIVYFLLLSRKERQPCIEDEAKVLGVANQKGTYPRVDYNY